MHAQEGSSAVFTHGYPSVVVPGRKLFDPM